MTKREAYDELIKLLNTNVDSAQVEGIILLLCSYFTTDDFKRELCGDEYMMSMVLGRIFSDGRKMMYQVKSIANNVDIPMLGWVTKY